MIVGVDQNSLFEAAMNILFRGGWVLAPIFLLGWFGWFLMLERYGYYFMLRGKSVSAFWTPTFDIFAWVLFPILKLCIEANKVVMARRL